MGGGGWGSVLVWVVPFLGVRGMGGRIIPVVGVLIVLGAMCTFGLVVCVSRSLVIWWRVVRFWRVRFPGEGWALFGLLLCCAGLALVCEGFGVWPFVVLVTISIQLRISTCCFWGGVGVMAGMMSFEGLSSLQGGVCSCCSFSGWSSFLFHCLRLVLLSVVVFVLPDGSRKPPYRLRCIAAFCVANALMVASSRIVLILLRSVGLRNLMVCKWYPIVIR